MSDTSVTRMLLDEAMERHARSRIEDGGIFSHQDVAELARMKQDAAALELQRAAWNSGLERKGILPYNSGRSRSGFASSYEDTQRELEWEQRLEAARLADQVQASALRALESQSKASSRPGTPGGTINGDGPGFDSSSAQGPGSAPSGGAGGAGGQTAPGRLASRAQTLVPSSSLHCSSAASPAPGASAAVAALASLLPAATSAELEQLCTGGAARLLPDGCTVVPAEIGHSAAHVPNSAAAFWLACAWRSPGVILLSPAARLTARPPVSCPRGATGPQQAAFPGPAKRAVHELEQPAASQQVQQQQLCGGGGRKTPDPTAAAPTALPARAGTPPLPAAATGVVDLCQLQQAGDSNTSDGSNGGRSRSCLKACSFSHSHRHLRVSFQVKQTAPAVTATVPGVEGPWAPGSCDRPAPSPLVDAGDALCVGGRAGARRRASICLSSLPSAAGREVPAWNQAGTGPRSSGIAAGRTCASPATQVAATARGEPWPAGRPATSRRSSLEVLVPSGASGGAAGAPLSPVPPSSPANRHGSGATTPLGRRPSGGSLQAFGRTTGAAASPARSSTRLGSRESLCSLDCVATTTTVTRASLDALRAADARGQAMLAAAATAPRGTWSGKPRAAAAARGGGWDKRAAAAGHAGVGCGSSSSDGSGSSSSSNGGEDDARIMASGTATALIRALCCPDVAVTSAWTDDQALRS
eukprot:CAMPEP_0202862432 /NCGR_PEP_ID=MMETSP1391-20130828/3476_1 /ASSEMBLY_ACC=CAM_ASM_000867 /TAXON_ID=1034604 /ORGANISM="Chlamydomonas leiostraca, Strain SAG 11-49" /LENGTH=700 /DNA_ID=CAMNT_0049541969 /DNA_START=101 /DNA_END=2204 /DNA_ORIENTATION=-